VGTSLIGYHAAHNRLTGVIPDLGTVAVFDASDNQLTGAIPAAISASQDLIEFSVGGNLLTGAVPAASPNLAAGFSRLCPNPLDTTPSGNDAGWNVATGYTPWWATPFANARCDDLFNGDFEQPAP